MQILDILEATLNSEMDLADSGNGQFLEDILEVIGVCALTKWLCKVILSRKRDNYGSGWVPAGPAKVSLGIFFKIVTM